VKCAARVVPVWSPQWRPFVIQHGRSPDPSGTGEVSPCDEGSGLRPAPPSRSVSQAGVMKPVTVPLAWQVPPGKENGPIW
jgi:hypothetical protein